jgi:hypothetical protein
MPEATPDTAAGAALPWAFAEAGEPGPAAWLLLPAGAVPASWAATAVPLCAVPLRAEQVARLLDEVPDLPGLPDLADLPGLPDLPGEALQPAPPEHPTAEGNGSAALDPVDGRLLDLLGGGWTVARAARDLGLSVRTAERRLAALRRRYRAKTTAELLLRALGGRG